MPKPVTIEVEVEEIAVGRVMRILHNTPGVIHAHWDMGDPKPHPLANGSAPRKERGAYAERGEDLIIKLLKPGKPLRTTRLREMFEKEGRGNSIASAIHKLKAEGLVESTPAGYVLTHKMKDRLRHRKGA